MELAIQPFLLSQVVAALHKPKDAGWTYRPRTPPYKAPLLNLLYVYELV